MNDNAEQVLKKDRLKKVLIKKHEDNKKMLSYLLNNVTSDYDKFNTRSEKIKEKYANELLKELKDYERREKAYSDLIVELQNICLLSNSDEEYNTIKDALDILSEEINKSKQEYLKEKQKYHNIYTLPKIKLALCVSGIIIGVATASFALAALYAPNMPDVIASFVNNLSKIEHCALVTSACVVEILGLSAGFYLFFSNSKDNGKQKLHNEDENESLFKDSLSNKFG